MPEPLTNQQLDEIDARANAATRCPEAVINGRQDGQHTWTGSMTHLRCELCNYTRPRGERAEETAALVAEVRHLRATLEQIRHLHKDSPMGPCPVCIDADAIAEGRDGLMPYPCPTGRLAGAQDCDPPERHTCHNQKTAAGPDWQCPHCSTLPPALNPAAAGSAAASEDGGQ
ncbi:hypothetical protein ACWD5Q_06645 [Streptomyces sp. NPDC002513]